MIPKPVRILDYVSSFCRRTVNILFGLLMTAVLVLTAFINKESLFFPNMASLPNMIFYLLALATVTGMIWILRTDAFRSKRDSKVFFICVILSGTIIVMLIQLYVCLWVPENLKADWGRVREAAVDMSNGARYDTLQDFKYISKFPNNWNITILFSWILRAFRSRRALIIIGAWAANLSATLTAIAVMEATADHRIAFFTWTCGEMLCALNWRSFLPYTDNYGMLFVALFLWLLATQMKTIIKLPLMIVVIMTGMWIKVTIAIVLIAVLLGWTIRDRDVCLTATLNLKSRIAVALACAFVFGVCIVAARCIDKAYEYRPTDRSVNWQYYLMLGQDDSGTGTVKGERFKAVYDELDGKKLSAEQRSEQYLEYALKWFKQRGIVGNLKFFAQKLALVYDDGQFHAAKRYDEEVDTNTIWYRLYGKEGDAVVVVANIMQYIWAIVILLNAAGIFTHHRYDNAMIADILKISIIGITMYQMIFEGRSKYLYMFLPLFLSLAGLALHGLLNRKNDRPHHV